MRDPHVTATGLTDIRQRVVAATGSAAFHGRFRVDSGGITLAFQHSMSPMARVLHHRFEEICRAELARLRRKTARSHLQGIVGRYGWTLWGCIQSATSTIDFDFWNWGMVRYEAAVADLKSPHITRLLEEAHAED